MVTSRQEKEAWIKAKYVEKKFLKKLGCTEILINGERKFGASVHLFNKSPVKKKAQSEFTSVFEDGNTTQANR